ncbi:MAG: hypothetical protein QW117_00440 [Candidatus Pacearchaeota archaeon]
MEKNYCDIIKIKEKEIERIVFSVNSTYYTTKIKWPGINPIVILNNEKENLLFIIYDNEIKICNPNNNNSLILKKQLEDILNEE